METQETRTPQKMLDPIAVAFSAKELIESLATQGYNQSGKVGCSQCGKEYALLFDETDIPSGRGPVGIRYIGAVRFFMEHVEKGHGEGHKADQLKKD